MTITTNPSQTVSKPFSSLRYLLLAAFIMGYGWGYRGTVGHEAGAMVPGALLGIALALGSFRRDWHQRAAVAGLLGACGWAWGGSFSYMEQTFYVLSDSFVDVLYGYTMLFFLGALWAGIGAGVLAFAFTEPRSRLEQLSRVFALISTVFLGVYFLMFLMPAQREALETLTVRRFHNTDWFSASLVLLTSLIYAAVVRRDRSASALFLTCAVAWWVGYLLLTYFGGIRLAPLHRSESWSGILGVLIVLLLYARKTRNRAALLLMAYGILGGGLAFSLAVFLRHPLVVQWGPFKGALPQWRFAEDTFGFLMGAAIALGVSRLEREHLAPPAEDTPKEPLDVFAVFVMLVALPWINFRRHAAPWISKAAEAHADKTGFFPLWMGYVLLGVAATLPVLYGLKLYLQGNRKIVPASAFGKGAAVVLALIWVTVAGYTYHDPVSQTNFLGHLLLWVPAAVASLLLISYSPTAATSLTDLTNPVRCPSDPTWRPGKKYALAWAFAPVVLVCITVLSMAMQEGPLEGMGRKRFGEDAYWRQTARLLGTWHVLGTSPRIGESPIAQPHVVVLSITFAENRSVQVTLASGDKSEGHNWFLKNQYIWVRWKTGGKVQEEPLQFSKDYLYVSCPTDWLKEGYLVLQRTENDSSL